MSVPKRQMSSAGVVPTITQRFERIPTARVPRVSQPPTLDGRLDDASWQRAPVLTAFEHYANTETQQAEGDLFPTECRLVHDGEALYIGFTCHHEGIELRQHGDIGRRDAPVYFASDAVEIFLDPTPADRAFAHLAVDHTNTMFDEMPAGKASYDGDWQAATAKDDGIWHVELRIPFAELNTSAPQPGERWKANFCRSFAQHNRELSSWAPIYGSFHNWPFFGWLEFE